MINYKKPKERVDYIFLAALLWHDIWKNRLNKKSDSEYFRLAKEMSNECPLCEMIVQFEKAECGICPLHDKEKNESCCENGQAYDLWLNKYWLLEIKEEPMEAKEIYLKCINEVREMTAYDTCFVTR